ncbi:hypothetical protein Tco_0390416 [Tanacetum coccineum]
MAKENNTNYYRKFIADSKARRLQNELQNQFIRDRDKIRVLEQERDNLQLSVTELTRQSLERQKTQTILKRQPSDKEDKYLNDILRLQAKNKDLENIVCKMGKSTETLRLLTNEQRAYQGNIRKSGLGYKGPYVNSQANAKIPKLYNAYELRDKNVQLHVFDFEETLEDADKSRLKMEEFQKDKKTTLAEDVKNLAITSCVGIGNKNLQDEIKRLIKESKDVSNESKTVDTFCNDAFDVTEDMSKRIVDLEKDLSKLEAKRNVRSTVSEFAIDHILGKDDSSSSSIAESHISELEKESGENNYKDFEDVKLELSNRTAKFKAYFEKLENTKVVLERKLARKVDDSKAEKDQFLKEINHLRTQLENLKGKSVETKFDKPLILGKPPADKLLINSQISKSWFTPKVVVQMDLLKPVTAQSLPKNENINF